MVDEKEFQKRVQKIGALVHDLDTIADPAARTAAKELVQLLMDLHGTGLERILEIIFQSGDAGTRIIDDLGQDSLVSSLLILYGIHPLGLQARVEQGIKRIGAKLNKMGAEASLVGVNEGEIRVRVKVTGHACGSTTGTLRSTVEEAVYEAAPDLTSLVIEGIDEPGASGFVGVEKLLGTSLHAPLLRPQSFSSEGMD